MVLKKLKYEELKIGMTFRFRRILTEADGKVFAALTGNFNPLHVDRNGDQFAKQSLFGQKIAFGMLAGSLFSTLIGMHCPGRDSLCLSQTLNFKQPIFYGDQLVVIGEIIAKNDALEIITLKTIIRRGKREIVTGEAKVKVLNYA